MAKAAAKTHDEPGVSRLTLAFSGILLVLPFITHFLAAYITQFLATFAPDDAAALLGNDALQGLVLYGFLTALLFFYLKSSLEPLSRYGWTWTREHLGLAVVIGLVAGAAMFGIDVASGYDFSGLPPFSFTALATILVGSALLPAVFEETLFRGVIQTTYTHAVTKKYWVVPAAVLVASAFEVAFHLLFPLYFGGFGAWTLAQVGYVALFGGIGGYLYSKTGSLAAPIAIHFLGNSTEYVLVWAFL